jgi:predicted nucleic acid-binding protein
MVETTVIISDTTCLIGLSRIEKLNLLHQLFATVIVTEEVAKEFTAPLPDWIQVQIVKNKEQIVHNRLFVHLGESSAIALAMEVPEAILVLDDGDARKYAQSLKLKITGTLGILLNAYSRGLLPDIEQVVSSLRGVGFRLPANAEELVNEVIKNNIWREV